MQITYFTHQYFPRSVGGTEVYTHGLAVRAQRAGHSVRVISHVESPSLDRNDFKATTTEHEGVPVTEIHYNLSRAGHPARAEYDNPHIVELLKPELERLKPDIVHAVHAMKLSGAALNLCYEMQLPVVLTLADYWFICARHTLIRWNEELCDGPRHDLDCLRCVHELHGFAGRAMEKLPAPLLRAAARIATTTLGKNQPRSVRDLQAIRERESYLRDTVQRADRVIALSDFQKEIFVRNGYPAEKIHVLHHGLETAGLKPAKSHASEPIEIVFIGSLVYHKGAHVVIEALARRADLKMRLRLYGDIRGTNPYHDSLKRLAATDNRVEFMGTFPPGELGRVFESADALAMPVLWYENEPLVVKAARYIGLPILASNIGTLAQSINNGINGVLLPPGDIDAWANAFASFRRHSLTQDLSIKSMDDNVSQLFALYQEIHSQRCSKQSI